MIVLDFSKIGNKIREKRTEKGWTQNDLALHTHIGISHISHIESGKSTPSIQNFIIIANALEIDANTLMCDLLTSVPEPYIKKLNEIIDDCDTAELRVLTDVMKTTLTAIRRMRQEYQVDELY